MTGYSKRSQVGEPKPKRRARLGESEKGREQRLEWQRERDEWRALHPNCEHPDLGQRACHGPLDVHHIAPRGAGGRRGPAGPLVTLCRAHHDWVETHRIEARALGLLIRRLA